MDRRQVHLAATESEAALTHRLSGAASWGLWLLLAAVSCGLYALLAWLSWRFEYTDAFADRPIPAVLAVLGAAFVVYLLAVRLAACFPLRRGQLGFLIAAGLAYRLILLPTPPIQEIDIYRYLWDGNVVRQGISPYRYPPRVVLQTQRDRVLDVPLARLAALRDANPHLRTVLERIHYGEVPSVYPPVSQAVFAAAAWSTPEHATVEQRMTILKIWFAACDLATVGLLLLLLRQTQRPPGLCIIYAWCPLVLKEFSNSGHLDAVAVALTTLAIWLAVRSVVKPGPGHPTAPSSAGTSRFCEGLTAMAACVALALAVGAKLYPIWLFPLLAASVLRRLGRTCCLAAIAVFLVTAIVVLWPLLPEFGHCRQSQAGAVNSAQAACAPRPAAADPSLGLRTFLTRWEMNDFLFMMALENLLPADAQREGRRPWFSVVPQTPREALIGPLAERTGGDRWQAAFFVARAVSLLATVAIAAWCVGRTLRNPDVAVWLESAFLTLAWFWFLSPTLNPWYWTWALPLLAFARSRVWLATSGVVLLYYLRFWFIYQFPDTPLAGTPYSGAAFFDFVVTWCEFGPWLAGLIVSLVIRRRRAA